VHNDSDRTGVRLQPADGAPPDDLRGVAGIAPEGTTLGAIQVPPDGRPIVLGPDRPVTGGYAKPAVVAAADVGRLALLRPGDTVRLTPVSLDEALALADARRAALPPRPS
jgi:allophanate hydrolase subunit 2